VTNVCEFPSRRTGPALPQGPIFCGKPMETAKAKPKHGQLKLVHDIAEIYLEIPADLIRGQAAYVFVSTVLQFSARYCASYRIMTWHVSVSRRCRWRSWALSDLDEIDILVKMINDELERRGGDTVA
jgi:hypothetical protein